MDLCHQNKKTPLRKDIQGLRGISIAAVVLFHMWDQTFKYGFLGVDVFFIISGFLMASILSATPQLTKSTVLEFYFRRFKRILPNYLFVIFALLCVSIFLMHPLEYAQLIFEAFSSIFFFSNYPGIRPTSYFDMHTSNYFLIHTWSLCVELQFYLIVPALFILIQFFNKIHRFFGFTLMIYLQCLSFWRQTWSYKNGDAQHMMPDGRLWQFIADHPIFTQFLSPNSIILKSVQLIGTFYLILFFFDIGIDNQQLLRLLITITTTIILSISSSNFQCPILTISPLVKLGDWSYSVYLIHWPIFVYHRYLNPFEHDAIEVSESQIGLKLGLSLIIIACGLGILLEETFKTLQTHLRSWISLISTLFISYLLIGTIIVYMAERAIWPVDHSGVSADWIRKMEMNVIDIWKNRSINQQINASEAYEINRNIIKYHNAVIPYGRNATVPTDFPVKYFSNMYIFKDMGQGEKNIVVIGNSHAMYSHSGIRYHFKDVYANLTLFVATACMLAPPEIQIRTARQFCANYVEELSDALRKWQHPIDIIMVFFGYARFADPPISENLSKDKTFRYMQDLHTNLTEIARDVVFMSNVSIHLWEDPPKRLQFDLKNGKKIERMGSAVKAQLEYLPQVRKRMQHLKCEKCIKIDFLRLWCPDGEFCESVDPKNHIAYFVDYHHVSAYGSMFLGKHMRELYDDYNKLKE